ncbi:hypothetical protein Dimus_016936 [Dionaea muscipula]
MDDPLLMHRTLDSLEPSASIDDDKARDFVVLLSEVFALEEMLASSEVVCFKGAPDVSICRFGDGLEEGGMGEYGLMFEIGSREDCSHKEFNVGGPGMALKEGIGQIVSCELGIYASGLDLGCDLGGGFDLDDGIETSLVSFKIDGSFQAAKSVEDDQDVGAGDMQL